MFKYEPPILFLMAALDYYGKTPEQVQAGMRLLIGTRLKRRDPDNKYEGLYAKISGLPTRALHELREGSHLGYITSQQFEGLAAPLNISMSTVLGKPTLTEDDRRYIKQQQEQQGFQMMGGCPKDVTPEDFAEAGQELYLLFRAIESIDDWVAKRRAA